MHLLDLPDNNQYPYQIVNSRRAKYIRIKLSRTGELSLVIPKGVPEKQAHNFIRKKARWVNKQLQQITVEDEEFKPESLNLKLLNEEWRLHYQDFSAGQISLTELSGYQLRILGDCDNPELLKKVINQWCKAKAKKIFKQMLEQLAEQHGFHYQRLSIRAQKTRWGSCSSKKSINLNCKLLFMPTEVVKYVMIHELCHTIEMNHSRGFWSLVEDCDPDYQYHRKLLKRLGKEVHL